MFKVISAERAASNKVKEGDTVYLYRGPDYGLTSMDSLLMGEEYIAVTLNKSGSNPFFTMPRADLVTIQ